MENGQNGQQLTDEQMDQLLHVQASQMFTAASLVGALASPRPTMVPDEKNKGKQRPMNSVEHATVGHNVADAWIAVRRARRKAAQEALAKAPAPTEETPAAGAGLL